MFDEDLLEILVCPENHSPLRAADERLLARLNDAARQGKLRNRSGRVVDAPLQGGLVREDNAVLYPIQDGIPVLLVDEAIELEPGIIG